MRSTLLLLLAAHALAQSADENAYSALATTADDACASISTGSVGLTVEQTGTTTATVTLSASTAMSYIALKDGWGTIIICDILKGCVWWAVLAQKHDAGGGGNQRRTASLVGERCGRAAA